MAGLSDAPGLILTAEHAMAPAIAVTVGTAAAQRGSRRGKGDDCRRDDSDSEERNRELFHDYLHFWDHCECMVRFQRDDT